MKELKEYIQQQIDLLISVINNNDDKSKIIEITKWNTFLEIRKKIESL